MKRRSFLQSAAMTCAALALPNPERLFAGSSAPQAGRTFEVTTRVEVLKPSGVTRVWLPAALITSAPFQRTLWNHYRAEGGTARLFENDRQGLGIVAATFPAGVPPILTLTSRVDLRDFALDLANPRRPQEADSAELRYFRQPSSLVPTDGIVKQTAMEITRGAATDLEKARAIYDWVVDNTFRDPKVRGCGRGDIRFMLDSRDLGGKCADLNTLYVGLARAAGLPARDVYGIRVAKSELGYSSLGASSDNITTAQHCRAEVYLNGYGWVPVDPADVRKVMLEEPPRNRKLDDPMVEQARQRLFGSWEMNWMAYNFSHDVALPGSTGPVVGFLMYPQAETDRGRLDSLDAATFKYDITAREIAAPAST